MHEAALTEVTAAIRQLLREVAPQVLGVIVRRYRDFAACEDAVQEAFIAAATQWPHEGMPEHPRAWLIQVASRRITDHVRAEAARQKREALENVLVPYRLEENKELLHRTGFRNVDVFCKWFNFCGIIAQK